MIRHGSVFERIQQLGIMAAEPMLQHIGSTAIPGIAAKPVIDMMLGVPDLEEARGAYCEPLRRAGYTFVEAFLERLPGRLFFYRETPAGERTHHLHIVRLNDPEWIRHLAFRDYLIAFPVLAKEYERLKLTLAKQYTDTVDYSDAKTDWIRGVEEDAIRWRHHG